MNCSRCRSSLSSHERVREGVAVVWAPLFDHQERRYISMIHHGDNSLTQICFDPGKGIYDRLDGKNWTEAFKRKDSFLRNFERENV